ncbi:MAG TPA: glycosyltransferase family 4 protein [Vicinamibacterales bacterium]|nr:glycosyltransferase family 4 protein [Vicinamibacterales bacterium]
MRVCMVSPHLPPVQAAVALLPVMLGDGLSSSGVTTSYVSHPSHAGAVGQARDVTFIARRGRGRVSRSKAGAAAAAGRMILRARSAIAASDLVHLHSNGLLVEAGAWLARRFRKPYIVTLYGTDVSAHDPFRNARYGRVVRDASARVFYSGGLLEHASTLGLAPAPSSVIYAPVSSDFHAVDGAARAALRRELGAGTGPVLLSVKHLRPVCGHETLLRAMPEIVRNYPDVMLWLAGDGDLRPMLESMARDLGLASHVRFLGRVGNDSLWKYYAAADLFVLASDVESWGTVMLEAMACGTPVVTTDTVGGREVRETFPDDVTVVPRGGPERLALAVSQALVQPQRASPATLAHVKRDFTVDACAAQYLAVYQGALRSRA